MRVSTEHLGQLSQLTAELGDAMTLDDAARAALSAAMQLDGVLRAGLAVSEGAGRRLQFVSTDEDVLNTNAVRWCLIDSYSDLPVTQAVREGQNVYIPSLEHLAQTFPDILERQRAMGTRSLAVVALSRGEERLGGLFLSFDEEREFDEPDRAFLSTFGAQVTQAVRRSLAYQIQYSASEQLQRSLMPHSLPDLKGLALGSYYEPGGLNVDVGGDWYDVMDLPDGSVVVSLGDVVGKGVPAAIVMGEVRAAMRAYAMLDPAPALVLERLDAMVVRLAAQDQVVTMLYGLIPPDRTSMRLAVAGHPAPLMIRGDVEPVALDERPGPALGLGAGPWPEAEVSLPESATVLFYSDGLVRSRRMDMRDGIETLREHVSTMGSRRRNPRELCARLGELVRREDADDDVTLLGVATTSGSDERSASTELPSDPTAAGLARRFVFDSLRSWDIDEDTAGVAELCVSELVTNSIIHSGTGPVVTVRVDPEAVLVLVQDHGKRGMVQLTHEYDPMDVSGRGLTLVDALATAWSAEHNPDGTTVWFEIALDRAAGDLVTDG